MDNLPKVGLSAVIDNLREFNKAADSVIKSYNEMNKAGDSVEASSGTTSIALGEVSSVLSGGLVIAARAAVAAITGVVASLGLVSKAAYDMASDVNSATNNIQTDLGITEEEATRLGEIATDIWANNFGESVSEVSEAIVLAKQRMTELNDTDLQHVVESAFMLQDAFGIDINESLNSVNTLMTNFGLNGQQALDFVTKGFQKGLNSSDDFLDTILEYSNLFNEADSSAEEFFSILETGLASGVLGTDKAADLFKEFQIRFLEGSDDVLGAVEDLTGDGWGMFIDEIQSGDSTITSSFNLMLQKLNEIENPVERNRLGVALMGTQFEDLGASAVLGIDITATSLEDLQGATDTLTKQYDNIGDLFQDIWRDALVALMPLGDSLLQTGKDIMPLLQEAINNISPSIEEFAKFLGENVTEAAKNLIPWIKDNLVPALFDLSNWIINTGIPALFDFSSWVWNDLIPAIKEWYKWFKDNIWPIILDVAEVIKNNIIPAIGDFANWIEKELMPALKNIYEWLNDNIVPIFENLFKLFSKDGKKAGGIISDIWEDISERLEPFIEEILPELLEIWEEILAWTKRNWPKIKEIIEETIKTIQKEIDKQLSWIEDFWEDWGNTILVLTENTFGYIWRTIKRFLSLIMDVVELTLNVLTGDWKGAWQNILDITKTITDQINDFVKTAFSNTVLIIKNALDLAISEVNQKWEELKTNIEQKLNEIKNSIQNIWNTIKTNVINAISSMMQGIVNTINNFASNISNTLNIVISNAVSSLLGNVTSGSIYNNLVSIGTKIINVISSTFSTVEDVAEKLRTGITDAIRNVINNLGSIATKAKELATSIINNIAASIVSLYDTLTTKIRTAISTAVSFVFVGSRWLIDKVVSIGSKIIDYISSSISDNFYNIKNKLQEVVEELVKEALSWLGISSPSSLMYDMGLNMAQGLALGLKDGSSLISSGLGNLVAGPLISTPNAAPLASSQVVNNQTFNVGGNTISNGMDEATFEARVMDVIRRNI